MKKMKQMTAAQKRVAIAKDVLKQIKARKFKVASGVFCEVLEDDRYSIGRRDMLKKMPTCEVCAVGAAIVSGIRLYNKLVIRDFDISETEQESMITKFFTAGQAAQIENAFETGYGWYGVGKIMSFEKHQMIKEKFKAAIKFGKRFRSDTSRAVAIFKNIIKNKGVFKP